MRLHLILVACAGCGIDLVGEAPRTTDATEPAITPSPPASVATSDGGSGAPQASAAPPANDAFTSAPPFSSKVGPSTKNEEHGESGDPAGLACVSSSCHGGGSGKAFRMFAGGTVFADAAGTQPASGIEIRIRDAAGNAVSAFTDSRGNFFVRDGAALGTTFPANAGARSTIAIVTMSGSAPNGDCNSASCHGGAAGRIHLP